MVSPQQKNLSGANAEVERLKKIADNVTQAVMNEQRVMRRAGYAASKESLELLNKLFDGLGTLSSMLVNDTIELAQLRATAATASLMNSSLEIDEVLNRAMDEVVRLTGAERGYILLKDESSDGWQFRVARSAEREQKDTRFQISKTVVDRVMETGEYILTDNATDDPRLQDKQSVVMNTLRSILCVPLHLRHKGEALGAVYVTNRFMAGVFTQREVQMLTTFADQAAIAIENARLFAQVKADLDKAKEEVHLLKIQLDHSKVDEMVNEITDNDYFQSLQSMAREMRNRNREKRSPDKADE